MISFILSQNKNICINEKANNLKQIIKNNLKIKLIKEDMNEYNILKIITNNSKNLLNYYKIIIDNIYNRYYIDNDENLKFPQCLKKINNFNKNNQYKLMNIISIFFFDSYRLINNYNFNDLFNFFNIFISKENNNQYNNNSNNTINYSIGGKNSSTNDLKTVNRPSYFLPPINKKYKYTLILDLDETLIYLKNKINISNNDKFLNNPFSSSILILRPGLIDFLKKMKQIYELIIFSSGTLDYIMPIIKIIEKKGKFFEYILYRKHISFLKNGEYYKDLSLLNRNLKNVIIVDDMAKNFVLHKSNGICIKPFKGDVINNRNTLELLGQILQKIRYDADITGDIRISLQEEKNIIYSEIATNVKKDYIDNRIVEDND
jgi:Dullard-like phosphatase family protein